MAWEENKHPRDKSGQFTSKGNEGRGGSNKNNNDDFDVEDDDFEKWDWDEDKSNRYTPLEALKKFDGSTVYQTKDMETGDILTFKSKEQAQNYFGLGEDFVENIDNIDYNKVDKNESKNKNKAKNPNRKDKYGNELISDEAFQIGVAGVNKYLDFMKQYYDYDKLKQSNIFLEGLQNAASKAIVENGYNPNSDMTNQDFNEIIGAALGDEIDIERNRFTGKKYNGYKPKGL